MDKDKILKAGEIAKEVKKFAEKIIEPGIPLKDIAEKIEKKIYDLEGTPAFPVNLSINEIAAHYTPSYNDQTLAHGLLKVDFGVHVGGWVADTAFSKDLEGSNLNKELIATSGSAVFKASEVINLETPINQIGSVISGAIEAKGFTPIVNLSGHSMEQYNLHAGITIPNIDDGRKVILKEGLYAIEPFVTTSNGSGKVIEGKPSGIYELKEEKSPRSQIARRVLNFIKNKYDKLPFCSRWIVNEEELGTKALFGLRELEANGNLYQFPQLIEASGAKVSQTEETIFIDKEGKVTVTTL